MYEELYRPLPDIDAYLHRIGINERPKKLDRATLDYLVYMHQCHVPFDTLDVGLLHKEIKLGTADMFDKVVNRNRGGYCFELNGLFCRLLQDLGYDAYSIPCRVMRDENTLAPSLHRGTAIRLDGKRLFCDVGFGGAMPPTAIEIVDGIWQEVSGKKFRFEQLSEFWYNLYRIPADTKEDMQNDKKVIMLQVGIGECSPADYVPMNDMCSKGEDARFYDRRVANIRTETGSKSIDDQNFTVIENGVRTVHPIADQTEFLALLKEHFGIIPV